MRSLPGKRRERLVNSQRAFRMKLMRARAWRKHATWNTQDFVSFAATSSLAWTCGNCCAHIYIEIAETPEITCAAMAMQLVPNGTSDTFIALCTSYTRAFHPLESYRSRRAANGCNVLVLARISCPS